MQHLVFTKCAVKDYGPETVNGRHVISSPQKISNELPWKPGEKSSRKRTKENTKTTGAREYIFDNN